MRDQLKIIRNKIITPEEIEPLLHYWHFHEQKTVFTNGCFDILHRGHVEYLAKAASFGDHLIVGLNTDNSVRRLKGPDRPLVDQESRAFTLAALGAVKHVILFDQDTPAGLIETIRPHVLVKGNDYKKEEIAGADFVIRNGGEVELIPLVNGYSTTALIDKIRSTS